ncbi:MAG: sulfite exporter TauE/SafE family protein [Pseudomonadota bacterium]
MPEALSAALALPTLPGLLAVTLVAGVVYGFAGFGAALIFLPIATTLVDPVVAIAAFSVAALSSLVTLIPRSWAECDRPVTLLMIGASTLTLPVGIYLLRILDQQVVQIAISLVAAATLILLISGFRLPVRPGATSSTAVAGAAGVVGGATGLLGPIVILFNLASGDDARRVRANTMVFLTIGSLFVIPQMALQGLIAGSSLWLGALMLPTYAIGGLLGRRLFNPACESLYRNVAYTIIALAVLVGLSDFL